MSLLQVNHLTMRFGGLTAVNDVTLQVAEGQIFSVIGPNGAGKTTLFNAITGIYNPTEGTVSFQGKQQYRPLSPGRFLSFLLIGAIFGLFLGLLAVNIDRLWLATIKAQKVTKEEPGLNFSQLSSDFKNYFQNNLILQTAKRGDRYRILYPTGEPLIPNVDKKEDAEKLLKELNSGKLPPVSKKEDDTVAAYPGIEEPVFIGDEADVMKDLARLKQYYNSRDSRLYNSIIGGCIGFGLGLLGSWTVFRRNRRTTDYIALGGIARTFQNIRLFSNMTILENVLIGMDRHCTKNPFKMALKIPFTGDREADLKAKAEELLAFVGISNGYERLARNLPYGDQRRLEIARALACQPKLLLLDEPAAGMNPKETLELMELIRRIRDRNLTILLIEHHMNLVMGISDRIAVLDHGSKIAEGTPEEIRNDPKVIEAYLGKEEVT